jgi:hypothetical protein
MPTRSQAIRNLVESANTAAGTTVEISVDAEERLRHGSRHRRSRRRARAVFRRFGAATAAGPVARGLGDRQTDRQHAWGHYRRVDRSGGGAVFTIRFPP